MARPSLRWRLVLLLLVAAGGAWGVIGALTVADARREIDAVLDAHLVQAATLLGARARQDLDESAAEVDDEHHDDVLPYATPLMFQIWDEGGRLLRRSGGAPSSPLTGTAGGFDDPVVDGQPWRTYSLHTNGVVVQVAESRAGREQLAGRFVHQTLWPLLAALPLFGLLVWIAVTRALRPLRLLRDDLRGRRASDLGPITVSDVPDEVAPLVMQLDELFARIRDRLDAERRFTSDAAHELRTPIAGIRAQAESALSATDGAEREAALGRVVRACDRLSRLVAQLLTLARMEEIPADRTATCKLDEIVQNVIADLAPGALAADVDLGLVGCDHAPLQAEALLVEVLVRNLIDNAVRYAGPGARVDVRVVGDAGRLQLIVSDDGPGLSAPELSRLGQPFFRAGQASGIGSGLGLSIVSRIAQRYGASVEFASGAGGRGLTAEVSFAH